MIDAHKDARITAVSTVKNKQTELLASALNTAATSCFSIGVATPVAGYLYNVGGLQASLSLPVLILGGFGWLGAAVSLHLIARGVLTGLQP